jgi:hypothetical protein
MEAFAIPDARDRVNEAVDALVSESIDEFSTEALGMDIIDIHRTIDRLEAELVRRLRCFDRAQGAQSDGGGTTLSWLRRCGMTVKTASYRVRLARALGELPAALDSAVRGAPPYATWP